MASERPRQSARGVPHYAPPRRPTLSQGQPTCRSRRSRNAPSDRTADSTSQRERASGAKVATTAGSGSVFKLTHYPTAGANADDCRSIGKTAGPMPGQCRRMPEHRQRMPDLLQGQSGIATAPRQPGYAGRRGFARACGRQIARARPCYLGVNARAWERLPGQADARAYDPEAAHIGGVEPVHVCPSRALSTGRRLLHRQRMPGHGLGCPGTARYH